MKPSPQNRGRGGGSLAGLDSSASDQFDKTADQAKNFGDLRVLGRGAGRLAVETEATALASFAARLHRDENAVRDALSKP